MANELWDLSEPVERMAVAMWAHEAWRSNAYTVARGRTLEAFKNESEQTRGVWIGLAGAALEALLKGSQDK